MYKSAEKVSRNGSKSSTTIRSVMMKNDEIILIYHCSRITRSAGGQWMKSLKRKEFGGEGTRLIDEEEGGTGS